MFITKEREITYDVKDKKITYMEKYKINEDTKEEIYDPKIEKDNGINLIDKYREEEGLLTSKEIENIREKYGLTQKEFAILLGLGEKNITRYENGMAQNNSIDLLMRSVENISNFVSYLQNSSGKFTEERYDELYKRYNKLDYRKRHALLERKASRFLSNFKTVSVLTIAEYLIKTKKIFDKWTLHKILYYIQGTALAYADQEAFKEDIQAWQYGPVVPVVYFEAENNRIEAMIAEILPVTNSCDLNEDDELDEDLKYIINDVINSYGKLSGPSLMELTHEEDPWINFYKKDVKNIVIPKSEIKKFFKELYEIGA